ncbi:MAG: Snf7 family protein [bacterium]
MALGDLFKSKAEKEKEQRKERRKAFRGAERAIDSVKDRIGSMKSERDKAWGEAREYLKAGQKGAAQRCLKTVRASEVMMDQLEKKRWVFEQLTTKLELARTDQEFSGALKAINTVMEIDPEDVAENLDEVQDQLAEQTDIDKIWDKMHDKEMTDVEKISDTIPSVDDMMKNLEDEVVADVRGSKLTEASTETEGGSSISEQIGEGRKRLNDLLEEDDG